MSTTDPMDRLSAGALVVGPVLLAGSTIAYINEGGINDGEVGGTLQVYAMGVLALGMIGLARLLSRAAPRAATVLLGTGVLGSAAGAAFGLESIWVARTGEPQLINSDGMIGVVSSGLPGLLFPATLVAFGVLFARTRVLSVPVAVAMLAGGALFPAGRATDTAVLALAADGLLIVSMGATARALIGARARSLVTTRTEMVGQPG